MEEGCGLESRGRNRQRGSNRDLIIRMLAEVFRVRQSEEGSIRWEQVSSSLVPVSLYSRTTETWLNRLTADLPIGQAASTMSPDSHRLLLMLHLSSSSQKFARTQHDDQDRVAFQVVAHDFYDGRFWYLLNSKIYHPGTKLGFGSDYFVYWKDTTNPSMMDLQQCQHSFASNQSPCCQHANQKNPPRAPNLRQTWGLNFASVNDAKLFYDVCSLNPVNLSFNPAFLKKFSKSIGYPGFDGGTLIRQRMLRNHTDSDLKSLAAKQSNINGRCSGLSSTTCGSMGRQHSSSRNASPRKQRHTSQTPEHSNFISYDKKRINSCIAHLRQSDKHRYSSNFRSRSCSTSRKESGNKQHSLDRNMSRSVHRLSNARGDVSDYNSINNPMAQHCQQQHQFMGNHNPNCETLLRQQELLRQHYHFHNYMCPKKPVRGQFRDSPSSYMQQKNSGDSPIIREIQQVVDPPDCGYISDQTGKKSSLKQPSVLDSNIKLGFDDVEQMDQIASVKFTESKSNQRRSTAVDTSSINRFNASLARANYAKSKNLSLDAGGFQSTPTPTHPVNWNDSALRKQTSGNEEDGAECQEEEQKREEELVPIDLVNNEVTCIKLHQESPVDPKNGTQRESIQRVSKPVDLADRRFSSSSIDYQLQLDALKVAVPYGFETNRCEASTTTDDLPLDPIVRKRMFQLTVAKAEKEIADKYSAETDSYLQSERLMRTMNELTSFQSNKTGARHAAPEIRCSSDKESCINQAPEPPQMLQVVDLPRPSFSAHQADFSDSSFVSSPDAEAVAFSMRTKKRVSRPSSSSSQAKGAMMPDIRSKTMPNIQQHQNQDQHGDYACCTDIIEGQQTKQFKSVPTIVDQQPSIYRQHHDSEDGDDDDDEEYNYDAAVAMDSKGGPQGNQLCYMQKLSNTLSSVSDFEH